MLACDASTLDRARIVANIQAVDELNALSCSDADPCAGPMGYPAILAAYDAVACSPEARQHPGPICPVARSTSRKPDDELICDIAFPLG